MKIRSLPLVQSPSAARSVGRGVSGDVPAGKVRIGGGKAQKVMFSLKELRCPLQGVHVHGPGAGKSIAGQKRRADRLAEDAVFVGLRDRRVPGMKGAWQPFSLRECGSTRAECGSGRGEVLGRDGRLQGKARHLPQRMNAGVGAARALGERGFAGDPAQGRLQFALDCWLPGLHLPAAEIGAVIGQGQLPGLWSGRGFGRDRSLGCTCISGYTTLARSPQPEAPVGYTQLSCTLCPFILRLGRDLGCRERKVRSSRSDG